MMGIPKVKRSDGRCISTIFMLLLGMFISFFQLSSIAYGSDLGIIGASDLNKNASGWTVLDARPKSEWTAGHIPGALSFSWEDYTRTDEQGIPYRVWQPQALAKALGAMGINENTPVVVYGDADKSWGEKAGHAGCSPGSGTKDLSVSWPEAYNRGKQMRFLCLQALKKRISRTSGITFNSIRH